MQNPNEDPPPSPIDEAVRDQERYLAEGIKQDTREGIKSRSEQYKLEQAALAAKAKADLLEQNRRIAEMEEGKGEPKTKRDRMFSVINGEVIPDPEGEWFLTEALKVAANQKESSGPVYYMMNPETGQYSAVGPGPVIIPQPTPPVIYQVDSTTGEVEELQPGRPIVVKPPPPNQQKNWMVKPNPDGTMSVEEVESGKPVIIQPPAPPSAPTGKSWMIKPNLDGSWVTEEVEPGKPIVIQPPAPPVSPSQPSVFQLYDRQGNPVQWTKEALKVQMEYGEYESKIKREEETHNAVIGAINEVKKHAGTFIKGIERAANIKEKRTSTQPTAQPQEEILTFLCDNHNCKGPNKVALRALQNAGGQFQCAHCGVMNQVSFGEQPAPAQPEGE